MALGTFTIVEKHQVAAGGWFIRATIVGESSYQAGGSTGLLAKLRTALSDDQVNILSVKGEGDNQDDTGPVVMIYDHANEKLMVRMLNAGGESADADQSNKTYGLFIVAA